MEKGAELLQMDKGNNVNQAEMELTEIWKTLIVIKLLRHMNTWKFQKDVLCPRPLWKTRRQLNSQGWSQRLTPPKQVEFPLVIGLPKEIQILVMFLQFPDPGCPGVIPDKKWARWWNLNQRRKSPPNGSTCLFNRTSVISLGGYQNKCRIRESKH